jgi:hypothetical protein
MTGTQWAGGYRVCCFALPSDEVRAPVEKVSHLL